MELVLKDCRLNIENSSINCIMGNNLITDYLADINKYNKNVISVIQPVIKQIYHENVGEYLEYALSISRHKKNKVLDSLKLVGLDISLDRTFDSLSESETFKVSLAYALIINPDILILESPNVFLDNHNLNNLMNILRTIKRRYQKTIIIFSNDSDFVHSIADKVILLCDKKYLIEGNKYEVFNNLEELDECGISVPKIIEFEQIIKSKKNINIGYRDNVNDLLKDICFFTPFHKVKDK